MGNPWLLKTMRICYFALIPRRYQGFFSDLSFEEAEQTVDRVEGETTLILEGSEAECFR